MKKLLFLAVLALLPFSVKAESLMGFMDGTLYDNAGNLKYICFMDNSCIDGQDNQTTRQALGLANLPNQVTQPAQVIPTSTPQTVYIPVYVQPTPTAPVAGGTTNPTMITDDTLVPYNNQMYNFKTIRVVAPSADNEDRWDHTFIFVWDGNPQDGELYFQGVKMLDKNTKAATAEGPFEARTVYEFTYNQGNRTVTRHFRYLPGVALAGW